MLDCTVVSEVRTKIYHILSAGVSLIESFKEEINWCFFHRQAKLLEVNEKTFLKIAKPGGPNHSHSW